MGAVRVADMHCDTLSMLQLLRRMGKDAELRRSRCHIDLEKMKAGGYMVQTFAIFSDADEKDPLESGLEQADLFWQEMEKNQDLIRPVTAADQIEKNWAEGKLSAMLSVEGGGLCRGNVSLLRTFYRLGVRMLTLTWNFENELAYPQLSGGGQEAGHSGGRGLKDQGIAFLEEMERLGIIIDVSHLSDDGFWDVARHTAQPFIASHSNARVLAPHPRNLTDDMIRCLADRGGVAGINFYSRFLDAAGGKTLCLSKTEDMVAQIRYMTNVGGMDCAGLGTDFDGIDCEVEIRDCSMMQQLAEAMGRAGFSESEIEKIFYKNVMRVFREILSDERTLPGSCAGTCERVSYR